MKQPERPSWVLVVAILQICFGSLGLLLNLCGGGIQAAGGAKMFQPPAGAKAAAPDVEAMMRAKLPHYTAYQIGGVTLGVVACSVMLASGIGLLKMRPWARCLTIGYACYFILSSIVGFVFALTVSLPVTREVYAELRKDPNFAQMGGFLDMMGTVTTVLAYASLVFLVYPVGLLVVMFLPHVRAAFRRAASPLPDEEEFDDEEHDDAGEEEAPPGEAPGAPPEDGIQRGEG